MEVFTLVFSLLVVYQIKHFLADYILQTEYQLGKFKKVGWSGPLTVHCGIHALMTLGIALLFGYGKLDGQDLMMFMVLDFVVHFITDKFKVEAGRNLETSDSEFWWLLGLDQGIHHLTHYAIIALIVMKLGVVQ